MTFPYEGLNTISAKSAITRQGRRLGFVFEFSSSAGGLLVRRVL
jgi:hypothetical protein